MIQIWLLLGAVTAALGAVTYVIHGIKESGREECRAEHQEAARMAELRQRERVTSAATKFQHDKREIHARDAEARKALVGPPSRCVDDDSLRILNDRIRQGRTGTGADKPLSSAPAD